MWIIAGFLVATILGLALVFRASRRGSTRREEFPWMLEETSKLHVAIVGNLAGFAFTGVILIVTLAHDRNAARSASLDTVVVMFLVAYLYWIGASFLISYLPHVRTSGDLVQRVHFSLATTIEYRTVFLSWFALLPLLQANGLGHLSPILYVLLPVSLCIGSLLVAMATDGLGLMSVREVYVCATIAAGLALLYAALVAVAFQGARSVYSAVYLTLVLFFVNGAGFALAATTPLSARYSAVYRFYERNGRPIVIADMYVTLSILTFLWLALAGAL